MFRDFISEILINLFFINDLSIFTLEKIRLLIFFISKIFPINVEFYIITFLLSIDSTND